MERGLSSMRCIGLIIMPLVGAGCVTTGTSPRARLADVRPEVSREELGNLLEQFDDTYEANIREAAEAIVAADPARRTRRLTLLWQTRLVPMVRDALNQDDAVRALLDVWTLCLRMQHYFREGDGRALFGDQQHLAHQAADRCVESIERVASTILSSQMLAGARKAVEDLAREYPMRGEFSGSTVRTAVQQPDHGADILTAIVSAPLAPFRAMEGIDRGADAIRGFTAVAARMNETMRDLPEQTRLQTELLLMEIENLESTRSALASFTEFSQASTRFAVAAERLPEDLRKELILAADDLETRQAGLQQTLSEAREVADRINESLSRIEASASAVEQTAARTALAGDAWTATFRAITDMVASFRGGGSHGTDNQHKVASDTSGGRPEDPAEPPRAEQRETIHPATMSTGNLPDTGDSPATTRGGFDIREYAQTAEALDRAAARLKDLTLELRGLSASGELPASLEQVEVRLRSIIELSRGGATKLTDHVAWRAAQLIVLIFALLAAHRVLRRLSSRGGAV